MQKIKAKQNKNNFNKIIVIAGPSASGKTELARRLARVLGNKRCLIICQDDYYKDWSHLSKKARKKINFDNAKAFDFNLLKKHIYELKRGKPVHKPCYCFKESKRLPGKKAIAPKPVVILEGLMPLLTDKLRRLSDCKVYIDIDNSISLARRLKRDITERAETVESVCKRYFNEVLPMQKKYVEPQKKWADIILNGRKKIGRETINRIIKKIDCGCR